jgi:argininosuccinate synthase
VGPDLRTKLIEFAEQHQIPIAKDKRGEAPFSASTRTSCTPPPRARCWRDPADEAPDYVYQRTVHPEDAPDTPEIRRDHLREGRRGGDRRRGDVARGNPHALNELGGKHGVGRLDLVEGRFVGMKSRGIYETPGGTILLEAHRGIERSRSTAARPPQGRADAALRGADLQRLLVLARARDAAGRHRQARSMSPAPSA